MNIYTSYFNKVKTGRYDNLVYVNIARQKPEWFPYELVDLPKLYPTPIEFFEYKRDLIDWHTFVRKYEMYVLDVTSKLEILKRIVEISEEHDDKDVVLLCWEGKDKPCHRHLVAEWLGCDTKELE